MILKNGVMILKSEEKARIRKLAEDLLEHATFADKPIRPHHLDELIDTIEEAIEREMVPLPQRRFIQELPPERRQARIRDWLGQYVVSAIADWFEEEGVERAKAEKVPPGAGAGESGKADISLRA